MHTDTDTGTGTDIGAVRGLAIAPAVAHAVAHAFGSRAFVLLREPDWRSARGSHAASGYDDADDGKRHHLAPDAGRSH
ncbi:hypothetical protein C6376_38170 [Streptomyces sp. P3]|uniref:hypothetical protein n=1 Tax=Streptomyces sp. P3 TaxID=2135430 RepID=UPI000D19F955|nr:hypothetical protein [Streptomyces sp. P3]AVV46316.1 hypothetical protein C6376_38170 [Streptomyces sp. P3]